MNLSQITWTTDLITEWLEIAAKVDKSLPPVKIPQVTGQKWNIIREWYELLWEDDTRDVQPKWQPTNEQITMWEEVVLRWFKLIDSNTDKRIVWMHACGRSWVYIGKRVHLSRQSVAEHHKKAIDLLTEKLTNLYTEIS